MKFAIISDIHGNQDALNRVMADINKSSVGKVYCLGDCIGYGPDSESVTRTIMNCGINTVMGNHEHAALDRQYRHRLNPLALKSLEMSLQRLSASSLQFISRLPRFHVDYGCRFVHGYPPQSMSVYLFQLSEPGLLKTMGKLKERVCFVGHTHELEIIGFDGSTISRHTPSRGVTNLSENSRYIVNVGSVGQPRDGDNRAKYAIYDVNSHSIDIRYVRYDIKSVVEKMNTEGFPEPHSRRLW